MKITSEHIRLREYQERLSNWKFWGPYLSERAWGTVREDYSADGTAWDYFPHDHARSRTYRWNEDGLAGICDRYQQLCFAIALWNGKDSILKERLFGLSGPEGNHGEDVKEYYYYLDSTPTHSYMKYLYKYPQEKFPYEDLVRTNQERGKSEFEYELLDTDIFKINKYFDVFVEYAKADQNDILIKITAINRGAEPAELHILPTLWFRNTWSWGYEEGPLGHTPSRPQMKKMSDKPGDAIVITHPSLGTYYFYANDTKKILFTENETNTDKVFGINNDRPYKKDSFHRYLIDNEKDSVNPEERGTKAAAYYLSQISAGESVEIYLRLTEKNLELPFTKFNDIFEKRLGEANEFYESIQPPDLSSEEKNIQRQAFAGLLWSKQLYHYDINQWLLGDPGADSPPQSRISGRNHEWKHLHNFDLISMPDKWEYPWYAVWDLAFHTIPFTLLDPVFAKRQLLLMTREWYMHPNGQLPAYEWAFDDVNPPVHAWATWRVYKIDGKYSEKPDRAFLERIYHKLLLNFTWWTNRKDDDGNNIFQGGFLGLDNISIFDRSSDLPTGGQIDQSDGTAWMAFFCLEMLKIALELAEEDSIYQDMATKFFEHFLRIAHAMTNCGNQGYSLWDEEDKFFYDVIHLPDGQIMPLKVRSLVGLIPLFAVETLEPSVLEKMSDFTRRMRWFIRERPEQSQNIASVEIEGAGKRHLFSILDRERLVYVLRYLLDPAEFLSEYGIRSLSKYHLENPYEIKFNNQIFSIDYQPAESTTGLFGGNSNWRGPIWFPINFLIIESLQKFHHFYGDDLKVAFPTGSENMLNLREVAEELSKRLLKLFQRDETGKRPMYGYVDKLQNDPEWRDHLLFFEYFHGDNGAGLGANHQTGWTGLIAKILQQIGEHDL